MDNMPEDFAPWKPGAVKLSAPYFHDYQMVTDPLTMGYWQVKNPGKPKLVFLHGWAEYGLDMARLAEPFIGSCDILALDARAHGLSDGPPSQYTMIERVQDILGVLEALDFHPDVFIGHSLGANCTLGLSLHSKNWVNKAVLLDPSWNTGLEVDTAEERTAQKEYWARTGQQWMRFSKKQLLRFANHSFPDWHPTDRQRWVEGKKMLKMNTLNGYDFPAPSWDRYIDYLGCEATLITGNVENGSLVTSKIVEKSLQRWSGLLDVVNIPGADHYVHHYDVTPIHRAIQHMINR